MTASKLRLEYQACIRLADQTDSKAEDKILRDEAVCLLKELRETCPHEHTVILHSRYDGSYSRDWDDSTPESRRCLCCGTDESAHYEFKKLVVKPFARFEEIGTLRLPKEIADPLAHLLSDCVEVAKDKGYR